MCILCVVVASQSLADFLARSAQGVCPGKVGVPNDSEKAGDADNDKYDKKTAAAEVASLCLVSSASPLPSGSPLHGLNPVRAHQVNIGPLCRADRADSWGGEDAVAVSASPQHLSVPLPPYPDVWTVAMRTNANPLLVNATVWHRRYAPISSDSLADGPLGDLHRRHARYPPPAAASNAPPASARRAAHIVASNQKPCGNSSTR